MKSTTVIGLGLLAFVTGAALAPGLASENRTSQSHFWADVQGAYTATPTGKVAFGTVGKPGEPGASFTITLGAKDAGGAIVFTRLDGVTPAPGRYPVGRRDGAGSGRRIPRALHRRQCYAARRRLSRRCGHDRDHLHHGSGSDQRPASS